jgi:hypothetical protein
MTLRPVRYTTSRFQIKRDAITQGRDADATNADGPMAADRGAIAATLARRCDTVMTVSRP